MKMREELAKDALILKEIQMIVNLYEADGDGKVSEA